MVGGDDVSNRWLWLLWCVVVLESEKAPAGTTYTYELNVREQYGTPYPPSW